MHADGGRTRLFHFGDSSTQSFAGDVYEGQWKGDKANGEGASLQHFA